VPLEEGPEKSGSSSFLAKSTLHPEEKFQSFQIGKIPFKKVKKNLEGSF